MKDPRIESHIPIPQAGHNKQRNYPFRDMLVGDSIFYDYEYTRKVASMCSYHSQRYGMKFLIQRVKENGVEGVRVWRIPPDSLHKPSRVRSYPDRPSKYPFGQMQLGQSEFFPTSDDATDRIRIETKIEVAASRAARKYGFKFVARRGVEEGAPGIRIHRVPAPTGYPLPAGMPEISRFDLVEYAEPEPTFPQTEYSTRADPSHYAPDAPVALPTTIPHIKHTAPPRAPRISRFDLNGKGEYVPQSPTDLNPPPEPPETSRKEMFRAELEAAPFDVQGQVYPVDEWETLHLDDIMSEVSAALGYHFVKRATGSGSARGFFVKRVKEPY